MKLNFKGKFAIVTGASGGMGLETVNKLHSAGGKVLMLDIKNPPKKYLQNKHTKKIFQRRKIESLYFENTNYQMYNDSIEGLTPRKKIRIRNYPEAEDKKMYLETKISSVEGRFKSRSIISKNKFNDLKNIGILDSQYGICKPCLYVEYDRDYFQLSDVRISIDDNIKYKLFTGGAAKHDESSIVELKTSIKKNLDELISDFPFQKIRFSKYCNAIEKIVFS